MRKYTHFYNSPLGQLAIITNDHHILEITFSEPDITDFKMEDTSSILTMKIACQWLDDYFAGTAPSIDSLPLLPHGTEFQNSVWRCLLEIPYGKTVTYGQIAEQLATSRGLSVMSPQAVGQAVGANPISIIIPCHRVIGANGKLTGYAGGIERKLWLLRHEKIL